MSDGYWTYRYANTAPVTVNHLGDGRLIATIHEAAYAPQIAATPDLYDALDRLTDITICPPDEAHMQQWLTDIHEATKVGLAALGKARGNG